MNIIDLLLIGIVLLSVWNGWRKGFILGLLELFSWITGLIATFILYRYVTEFLEKYIPSLSVWTYPVSFILTIVVVRIIIGIAVNGILRSIPSQLHYNMVNRIAGTIPGLINGVLYAAIIATILLLLPLFGRISPAMEKSILAGVLTKKVELLQTKFSPVFRKIVNKSGSTFTIEPQSGESIKLPFKVAETKVRPDLEQHMLRLLNKERQKAGLKPLEADSELRVVARKHSADMFARGYFSHITPEGKNPFDRMRAEGVSFITAGENLALAQTLAIAHDGLMNSPGHRANILRPAFGRVGIGIQEGGVYGLMITQNFRN
ncbi:CvpA family protein [Rubrolithibacter danxiaensis]|uniref:CvpA family protein n=1 Tax=Rubrolithibacter danxiaensis TaxID=3390805 RepID=UPI003BF78C2E